ncbi:hypothetical protein ACLB2K_059988 [Fragaria x ananassa]
MNNADDYPQANGAGPQANGGGPQVRFATSLKGLEKGLARVGAALKRLTDGANILETEPAEPAYTAFRPLIAAAIRANLETIQTTQASIQEAVDDIGRGEGFPAAEVRRIIVAVKIMTSSALAIHSILVHSADGLVDGKGGFFMVQHGLVHLNVALTLFQRFITNLQSLEPAGFVWDDHTDDMEE